MRISVSGVIEEGLVGDDAGVRFGQDWILGADDGADDNDDYDATAK